MDKTTARVRVMVGRPAELELLDLKTRITPAPHFCFYPLFIWINSCIDMLTELLNQVLSLYPSLIELPSSDGNIHQLFVGLHAVSYYDHLWSCRLISHHGQPIYSWFTDCTSYMISIRITFSSHLCLYSFGLTIVLMC